MTALPHFAAPFEIGRKGAKVVEQGTPEQVQASVYNICVCETGFREDAPTFGRPPLLFNPVPLDITQLKSQIERFEPHASVVAAAELEAMIPAYQSVRVEVGERSA